MDIHPPVNVHFSCLKSKEKKTLFLEDKNMDAYFTNTSDNDISEIPYDYELESLKDEMRIAKYHNENAFFV